MFYFKSGDKIYNQQTDCEEVVYNVNYNDGVIITDNAKTGELSQTYDAGVAYPPLSSMLRRFEHVDCEYCKKYAIAKDCGYKLFVMHVMNPYVESAKLYPSYCPECGKNLEAMYEDANSDTLPMIEKCIVQANCCFTGLRGSGKSFFDKKETIKMLKEAGYAVEEISLKEGYSVFNPITFATKDVESLDEKESQLRKLLSATEYGKYYARQRLCDMSFLDSDPEWKERATLILQEFAGNEE